jgi:hypothetical protein
MVLVGLCREAARSDTAADIQLAGEEALFRPGNADCQRMIALGGANGGAKSGRNGAKSAKPG